MSAPIAELRSVARRFGTVGTVSALRDVSLRINSGEMVALVGPSGSGKSTLLNMVGLLDRPDEGSVVVAGRDTTGLRGRDVAMMRALTIGFVFQDFHLVATKTAAENVAIPLLYQPVPRRVTQDRVARAMSRLGVGRRANHYPGEMSGGERQRVAIARALVTEPALLLADEPTGNLDSHNSANVIDILRGLADDGIAVVVATHDPVVAGAAHRQVRLVDGRVDSVQ